MNRAWLATGLLSIFAAVAGCSLAQPSVQVNYYQVEYPQPEALPKEKALPAVVGLRRFSVAALYDSDRLVQLDKDLRSTQSYYQRWAINPRMMLSDLFLRDMQVSGAYQAVVMIPSTVPLDYEINGYLREVAKDDSGPKPVVKLALEITLLRGRERKDEDRVIFQKSYTAQVECANQSAAAVAKAMSEAFADISVKIRQDVYEAIAAAPNA